MQIAFTNDVAKIKPQFPGWFPGNTMEIVDESVSGKKTGRKKRFAVKIAGVVGTVEVFPESFILRYTDYADRIRA